MNFASNVPPIHRAATSSIHEITTVTTGQAMSFILISSLPTTSRPSLLLACRLIGTSK
jgi:hypothetical protein